MVGKQRTAKTKKPSINRERPRQEKAEVSETSEKKRRENSVFTSVEDCLEVFDTSKKDVKRLLELKIANFNNAVLAFTRGQYSLFRPNKYNSLDKNCIQVMMEMYILDIAVEMQQKTFYKMAQEVLSQVLKPSLDLYRKIQKLIAESNELIQVQLHIENLNLLLRVLCNSAAEMEKLEVKKIAERRAKKYKQ